MLPSILAAFLATAASTSSRLPCDFADRDAMSESIRAFLDPAQVGAPVPLQQILLPIICVEPTTMDALERRLSKHTAASFEEANATATKEYYQYLETLRKRYDKLPPSEEKFARFDDEVWCYDFTHPPHYSLVAWSLLNPSRTASDEFDWQTKRQAETLRTFQQLDTIFLPEIWGQGALLKRKPYDFDARILEVTVATPSTDGWTEQVGIRVDTEDAKRLTQLIDSGSAAIGVLWSPNLRVRVRNPEGKTATFTFCSSVIFLSTLATANAKS